MEPDRGQAGGLGKETAIQAVIRSLQALRGRLRVLLLAERLALLLAMVVAAVLVIGLADFFLRTPGWLRLGVWAGGIAAVAWGVWQLILPAVRFRPPLSELALRIERSPAAQRAGLPGVLAAGVELAAARERGDLAGVSANLAAPVVLEAAERYQRIRARDVVSVRRAGRSGALLGGAAAVILLLGAAAPALLAIGAARVLAPWSGAQWPKRTMVVSATEQQVHPLGEALALRAVVGRRGFSPQAAASSRVWGNFRLIDADGKAGPVRSILLTSQDRVVDVPGAVAVAGAGPARGNSEMARGMLFERLIEPTSLAQRDGRGQFQEGELEYWFQTDDDVTGSSRIRLVNPPAVAAAYAQIAPPAYASASGEAGAGTAAALQGEPRTADLGPGNDERAVLPALLAGSRIRLSIELNKPVPPPPASPDLVDERLAWIADALGEEVAALAAEPGQMWLEFTEQRWQMEWVLRSPLRLPVRARDEHGLSSVEESVYRFEALMDEPPTATVTEPDSDRTILPSAVVDVRGEARDDVGLSSLALQRQRAARPPGSEGAPAEATEEWVALAARTTSPETAAGQLPRQLAAAVQVDVSALELRPGDELWLSALAADNYELDGQTHDAVRSPVRRLIIISEEEFAQQIWSELGSLRRAALRLDEEQQRLNRLTAPGTEMGPEAAEQARRGQAAVTERLAREREALERLQQRMGENRFSDRDLDSLVQQAGELVQEAGRRSVQASEAVEQVARAEEAGQDASEADRAQAAAAQNRVRDTLGDLADLLDQGQDTWALRRSIERALEEQRALRDRTRDAAGQTAGKGSSELSPQERQMLEQIAREQEELAERTAESLQRMQERAEQLREQDPAMARTVEQAAQRGQNEQVPQRMADAAEQVEQNQTSSAMSQQDRAIQSLEQMLQDMDQAAASRDAELRRILADLMQSIDMLIREQQAQLDALAAARPTEAFAALPEGMIRLHQNTLGVLEQANSGPRELAPVADLIDRAAGAQSRAITALRAEPVDADAAQQREEESLELLKRAREEAQRLDEEAAEREAARRAAALKRAYREILTEQVAIAEETEPLVGIEANRRTRAQARQLGDRQSQVRQRLSDLLTENPEIGEKAVFSLAHDRLDTILSQAAETLAGGEADRGVSARQASAIRILQSLVEALDTSPRDEDFRDNPQDDESGAGGQGAGSPPELIPDIAELRLLRALQLEAAEITRMADELADAAAADDAAKLQEELLLRATKLLEDMSERQQQAPPTPPTPPTPPVPPEPDAPGEEPPAGGGE